MIKYCYSPGARGFFRSDLSARVPDDAVPVSEKRHAQLMQAQAEGAAIVACPKTGKPLAQLPPCDPASLRAMLVNMVKSEAGRRIRAEAPLWRQINDATAIALGEIDEQVAARLARITAIRAASDRIEEQIAATATAQLKQFPVATNPLWPALDQGTD